MVPVKTALAVELIKHIHSFLVLLNSINMILCCTISLNAVKVDPIIEEVMRLDVLFAARYCSPLAIRCALQTLSVTLAAFVLVLPHFTVFDLLNSLSFTVDKEMRRLNLVGRDPVLRLVGNLRIALKIEKPINVLNVAIVAVQVHVLDVPSGLHIGWCPSGLLLTLHPPRTMRRLRDSH